MVTSRPTKASYPRPCRESSPPGSTRSPVERRSSPGRGRDRPESSARRSRTRALDARGAAALLERKEFVEAPAAQPGRRRGRVRVPARAGPRSRVRAVPRARRRTSIAPRPPGSSRSAGPRITPRCLLTTTPQPSRTHMRRAGSVDALRGAGTDRVPRSRRSRFCAHALTAAAATTSSPSSLANDDPGSRNPSRLARTHQSVGRRERSFVAPGVHAQAHSLRKGVELAAEADALLAQLCGTAAEPERSSEHLERASGLVQASRPPPPRPASLSEVSRYRMLGDETRRRPGLGTKPSPWLGPRATELRAHGSTTSEQRGATWATRHGTGGTRAQPSNGPSSALVRGRPRANNLAISVPALGDLRRATPTHGRRDLPRGERARIARPLRFSRDSLVGYLFQEGAGTLHSLLGKEFLAACDAGVAPSRAASASDRASVRLRATTSPARSRTSRGVVRSRTRAGDPQAAAPWLARTARFSSTRERRGGARVARRALEHASIDGGRGFALVAERSGTRRMRPGPSTTSRRRRWTYDARLLRGRLAELRTSSTRSAPRSRGDSPDCAPLRLVRDGRRRKPTTAPAVRSRSALSARDPLHPQGRGAPREPRDSRVAPARARSPRTAT